MLHPLKKLLLYTVPFHKRIVAASMLHVQFVYKDN